MDLSDIPTEDLQALQNKDLSKVSTTTLQKLASSNQDQSKQPGFIDKYGKTISNVARPALEIGGSLGGAALGGGPTGGIGTAVGGALGYAGGKATADLLDRSMGLKKPIGSMTEAGKEAAGDLASGVGMEAGGAVLGKVAPTLLQGAKMTGKGLMSVLFGPSVNAIDMRFLENAAIKNAKPFDVLAKEFPKDVMKLSDKIGEFHDTALASLSKSKALVKTAEDAGGATPRDTILKAVDSQKTKLGRGISDATFKAKTVLEKYAMRLEKLGPTVSQNELGHIVRDIDNDIDWEKTINGPANKALEGLRTTLDRLLKFKNPQYGEAMKPVSDGMKLLNKTKALFLLKKEGKELVPSNMTATAIKNSLGPLKIASQDVLKALEGVTGRDYMKAAENAHVADQFVKGAAQGSRRVNLGAALGAGAGGLVGGHVGMGSTMGAVTGALGGGAVDVYGPQLAGKIIDQLVHLKGLGISIPSGVIARTISAALTPDRNENQPNQ